MARLKARLVFRTPGAPPGRRTRPSGPKANPYDAFSDEELTEQKESFWAAYYAENRARVSIQNQIEALEQQMYEACERGEKAYRDAIDIENELKRRNDLTPMTLLVNGLKSR
jgi:hypothetical protein